MRSELYPVCCFDEGLGQLLSCVHCTSPLPYPLPLAACDRLLAELLRRSTRRGIEVAWGRGEKKERQGYFLGPKHVMSSTTPEPATCFTVPSCASPCGRPSPLVRSQPDTLLRDGSRPVVSPTAVLAACLLATAGRTERVVECLLRESECRGCCAHGYR
jgi:hypothetical protein